MFLINEWLERYEVNDKGQPARVGDKLRVSPLEYIRSKVHGRSQGAGFARLQGVAGNRCYEVFGIFQKFLEIAGCEQGGKRGKLLNEKGNPATVEDLAFLLRTSEKIIKHSLQVLTDTRVGWMQDDSIPEIPGIPGILGSLLEYNSTQLNSTQLNTTKETHKEKPSKKQYLDNVFLNDEEYSKLVERFGDKETTTWIEKLDSYIGSKGKKYKSHYKTIISWSLKDERNGNAKSKSQRTIPERSGTSRNDNKESFIR